MNSNVQDHGLPIHLNEAEIEEFGRELDAIKDEVFASRGEHDRAYILAVIKAQRSLALGGRVLMYASLFFVPGWPHALAGWSAVFALLGLGTLPRVLTAEGERQAALSIDVLLDGEVAHTEPIRLDAGAEAEWSWPLPRGTEAAEIRLAPGDDAPAEVCCSVGV